MNRFKKGHVGGTPPEDMASTTQAAASAGGKAAQEADAAQMTDQGGGSPKGSQNAFSKYQSGGDEPVGMTPPGDNID